MSHESQKDKDAAISTLRRYLHFADRDGLVGEERIQVTAALEILNPLFDDLEPHEKDTVNRINDAL